MNASAVLTAMSILGITGALLVSAPNPLSVGDADKHPAPLWDRMVADVRQAVSNDLTWDIAESGRVTLAGITYFDVDDNHQATIEARRSGDFLLHPSISFQLPVTMGPDGQFALTGLKSAGWRGDKVRLVVDRGEPAGARAAGEFPEEGCAMFKPVNCDPLYCSGACSASEPNCGFDICNGTDICCKCQQEEE